MINRKFGSRTTGLQTLS